MPVRKSAVVALIVWLAGTLLVLAAPSLLPERYYYDARTLRMLILDPLAEYSPSFYATARIYEAFGFGTLLPEATARVASFTLSWLALLWASGWLRAPWRPWLAALVSVWAIPLAVYHGQYSKEPFAMLAVAAALVLSRSWKGVAAGVLVVLGYAALFRTYWVVIIALWLALILAWRHGLGWPARLGVLAATFVPLSLASQWYAGIRLSDARAVAAEGREGDVDAATVFFNIMANSSVATDLVNTAAGWATLLFPVYLLQLGAVQHIAFALFQFVNTIAFIRVARRLSTRCEAPGPFEWRANVAIAWCIAYTVVLGMIEPDFGSFVKHETNLLPMLLFVLAWIPATRMPQPHVRTREHAA